MSAATAPLSLFSVFGIELEYMTVRADTGAVLPVADHLLRADSGAWESNCERGELGWSNELVLHVIELKTKAPVPSLAGVAESAARDIQSLNQALAALGGCLMPTAMHPWMNPAAETRLWPHEYSPVYEAFHRVFGCQGHGWSNLQSMHINLPFANAAEFGRLHAAIRLVLPLLPALAASSPIQDGRPTGFLDNRLRAYRTNCQRVPSITGQVIPEPVFDPDDYQKRILERIYREIAPLDPAGVLQEEWLNARGAIARFERDAIEIRLLDVQEAPRADLAIAMAVVAVLRAMTAERWLGYTDQQAISNEVLVPILNAAIQYADEAVIDDPRYLATVGIRARSQVTLREVWRSLLAEVLPAGEEANRSCLETLNFILDEGCLSRRILKATGPAPDPSRLRPVYFELCQCLAQNRLFSADRVI
jgi:carboxylate-amine ligase